VIELSLHGFQAECAIALPDGARGEAEVELGAHETSKVEASAVRRFESEGTVFYGFHVPVPDEAWRLCVEALQTGRTHADLAAAPAEPAAAPRALPASNVA
jgi:hypothetical protein